MNILKLQLLCLLSWSLIISADAGKWYQSRMLRNPGLVAGNASSFFECVSNCEATANCSAVSYKQYTGECIQSRCNSLDMFKTNGWNTYVAYTHYVDGVDMEAPLFEWMLTDSCGNKNFGTIGNGPNMNLNNVNYAMSQSKLAGKAVEFKGVSNSYGKTASDSRLYNPMGSKSITLMTWIYWYSNADSTALFEFVGSGRGFIFWYLSGGFWYDLSEGYGTSANGILRGVSYSFTPVVGKWYHLALVYDGRSGIIKSYVNYTLMTIKQLGSISNYNQWNFLWVAGSGVDSQSNLDGKLYCHRIYHDQLTSSEIEASAKSCYTARVRLSG